MRIPIALGVSLVLIAVPAILVSLASAGPHPTDRISVAVNEQARRVDVSIDGQPFTSYIWPTTLKKPVLYPLRTAKGTVVTRGFPLEQRPGERVDHPHHAGLWFNYENVNGIDFWNNSDAIKPENAPKMGTISIAPSSPQRAAPTRANSMSNPIGSPSTKKFCSRNTPTSSSVAAPAFAAWTASPRSARSTKTLISRMRKTASWAFASSALSKSLRTNPRSTPTPAAAPPLSPSWTTPASTEHTSPVKEKKETPPGALADAGATSAVLSAANLSPSPFSITPRIPASPPIGTPAATAFSPPTRSGKKSSATVRKS